MRHRRGYGIHSPWAFSLVTQVVYNDGEYYAYELLRRHYKLRRQRLWQAQLLFRLANHAQPHEIVVPPTLPEAEQAYLQAGCLKASVRVDASACDIEFRSADGLALTIILDLPHRTEHFREVKSRHGATITFDILSLALIYYNLPLTKQDYLI